ncbi:IS1380 family transposase [Companilactobacillus huachuanensis]|uniref:IS1380 family transposase n=1 Tax=Companilactobacillus huachuanensis TaxID=2559914 RepID=A0ABW1RP31_9LACO|nr:IS1380 family transposase [Companilactobacillus huachuanensis]
MLLDALVRPGNEYTGKDADKFIIHTLDHIQSFAPGADIVIRGDSGFAAPAFYDVCSKRDIYFIVRLKSNATLNDRANDLFADTKLNIYDDVSISKELNYRAKTWSTPYRVVVNAKHKAGELAFWTYTFVVTNMDSLSSDLLFPVYHDRGNVENDIKELKNGFGFDKTNSSTFIANAVRALIGGIAYNLMQLFKCLLVPKGTRITAKSLRFKLFHIAGRVTNHAHLVQIHLASNYHYKNWFFRLLHNIQKLIL